MHPSIARLATNPAELDEPPIDTFAERLAEEFKAEPKLNERRALQLAVETAREVFNDAAPASDPQADWSAITSLLIYIIDSASPGVTVDAIAHAMGLIGQGEKAMAELGKKHGVTRQSFSKHCLRVVADLHLPTETSGMRTPEKRQNYHRVQVSRCREIEQDKIASEEPPITPDLEQHEAGCTSKSQKLDSRRTCPICGK